MYMIYKILQESEACIIKRIKKRQPYVWNAPCNWEEKTKFCGGVLVKGNILGRNQQKGKFATDFEHRAFIKKHYLSIGKDIRFYNEIGDVVTATHYKRPEVKSKPVKLPETSTECTKIDYGLHKAIRDYKDILKPMSENVTDGSNSCGKRYV